MNSIRMRPKAFSPAGKAVALKSSVTDAKRHGCTTYSVSIRSASDKAQSVDRVRLFSCYLPGAEVEVFRNGFFMPSDPVGFYVLRAGEPVPRAGQWNPRYAGERDLVSHSLVVLALPDIHKRLLVGFTSFNTFHGWFLFYVGRKRIRFSAWCDLEGITLTPGQQVRLEDVTVIETEDFQKALEQYAEHTAVANHARVARKTVTGWSDWQYYREEKTEADILRSVKAMRPLRAAGCPIEYIIVDGGWCKHASEWLEPCDKFPSGMKKLSQRLRREGLKLGVWLAPYLANVHTRVVREHRDWLVKDRNTGKPLSKPASNVGPCNMIDFTVPEALEWLRSIVRLMVRDWRIGYLKLDGPCLTHWDGGVFRNPNITSVQVVRQTLQLIREECGDDVIVEGEGIYGPSIGLVDTQRTTQDNHPIWRFDSGSPRLKVNMQHDLLSGFLHRRFWHNHRENIILRDFCSPQNPPLDRILPENEMLLQLAVASMGGGALLLTDPMDELMRSPKALERISQVLPPFDGDACAPIDVFRNGRQPSLYSMPVSNRAETWFILGVFNWDDHYADYVVPLDFCGGKGAWHAHEFWTQTYLGCHRRTLAVRDVPAHGCRVIALRRKMQRPQFIGGNLHIFQGAVEVRACAWDQDTLRVRLAHPAQPDRKLVFWHPRGYRLARVHSNVRDHLVDQRRRGLVTIHFNGRRKTDFELSWIRS